MQKAHQVEAGGETGQTLNASALSSSGPQVEKVDLI